MESPQGFANARSIAGIQQKQIKSLTITLVDNGYVISENYGGEKKVALSFHGMVGIVTEYFSGVKGE